MNKTENKDGISGIILSKNSESTIANAIDSLEFADEIIVVDTGSSDKTLEIAKYSGCKTFKYLKGSYPNWRNFGSEKASGKFLIYLDSDEEIDNNLKEEIIHTLKNWPDRISCYALPRKNVVFGKILMHGGWYPDYVIRLFKKNKLINWVNELHEQPKFEGVLGYLKNALIHHKEKTLHEMVVKTNIWSEIEAKLMYNAGHPPMTVARFLSAMFREFYFRFVKNLAFLDGAEGIIFGLYQVYSKFISYAKLWELQGGTHKLGNPSNK